MLESNPFYVEMGKILIEKTKAANPDKGKKLDKIAKNSFALEAMAKMYESNAKNSNDIGLFENYEMIASMAKERLAEIK